MQICKAVPRISRLSPVRRLPVAYGESQNCGETPCRISATSSTASASPGTSGRFADVFNPATGEVQARVPLASRAEVAAAVAGRQAAQPRWAATNPQRRARVMMRFVELLNRDMDKLAEALSPRARQDPARRQGRRDPRPRGRRVLHRRAAPAEGRVHRRRRPRHRHVLDAPAARRRRRDHPVQLPGDDPDVEDVPGDRLRQRLHPEALASATPRCR